MNVSGLRCLAKYGGLVGAAWCFLVLTAVDEPACSGSSSDPMSDTVPLPEVVLSAGVDRVEATPGDPISYTVTLSHEEGIAVELPEVLSKIVGFKVSNIRDEGPKSRDNRVVIKKILELKAFEGGSYVLPALEVVYSAKSGKEVKAGAPQIFVEIKSVLHEGEATEDIVDIKDVVAPPRDYRKAVLLAGLLGVGLGLVFRWSRYRRKRVEKATPPAPPWTVAAEQLKYLEDSQWLEQGNSRAFSFQLSEILRRYLEDRFQFPAMEETTEEIFASFKQGAGPSGNDQDLVRSLLITIDRSKFAQAEVASEEGISLISNARRFVTLTTPASIADSAGAVTKEVG